MIENAELYHRKKFEEDVKLVPSAVESELRILQDAVMVGVDPGVVARNLTEVRKKVDECATAIALGASAVSQTVGVKDVRDVQPYQPIE